MGLQPRRARGSNASNPHKTPQPWGGQRLTTGSVTVQTLLVIPIGATAHLAHSACHGHATMRVTPSAVAEHPTPNLEVLQSEGITFRLNATCIDVAPSAGGVRVGVDCTAGAPAIDGSHVLFAVGRRPNTDDLGVAAAGLTVDARGFLTVDDQCRTNVEGVWALGECNGRGAFTHTAYNDYEVVADTLLDGGSRRLTDRIPCYALYTDPPVGRVGMSLAEARASGRRLLVGHRPMAMVARAKEMSETAGFMRAIVDADTERILGAVVFGINGDEIVHSLLDVMYAGAPYTTVSRAVHIHPTVSELVPTMLQELRPLE